MTTKRKSSHIKSSSQEVGVSTVDVGKHTSIEIIYPTSISLSNEFISKLREDFDQVIGKSTSKSDEPTQI